MAGGRHNDSVTRLLNYQILIAAASIAWVASLAAASFVAGRGGGVVAYGFAAFVYAVGSAVCHQLPARSFALWGAQMPVCARCTGIYLGAAFAGIVYVACGPARAGPYVRTKMMTTLFSYVGSAYRRTFSGSELRPHTARLVLIAAALPAVASLLYEWTTGDVPSNTVRALTGIILGAAVARSVLK